MGLTWNGDYHSKHLKTMAEGKRATCIAGYNSPYHGAATVKWTSSDQGSSSFGSKLPKTKKSNF